MIKVGEKYRHFKGNEYEIVAIEKDSETLAPKVVYKALYGENQVWVRDLSMFEEIIERDSKKIKRFEKID